jgi:hypothetical protein
VGHRRSIQGEIFLNPRIEWKLKHNLPKPLDTGKAALTRKCIAMSVYIKKPELSNK